MIWVRKTEDEQGSYVDGSAVRWAVDWLHKIYCPCGLSEAEHGYEAFESMEAALEAWGLMPWVDPEQEELEDKSLSDPDGNG